MKIKDLEEHNGKKVGQLKQENYRGKDVIAEIKSIELLSTGDILIREILTEVEVNK